MTLFTDHNTPHSHTHTQTRTDTNAQASNSFTLPPPVSTTRQVKDQQQPDDALNKNTTTTHHTFAICIRTDNESQASCQNQDAVVSRFVFVLGIRVNELFGLTGRADIQGSRSNVALNAHAQTPHRLHTPHSEQTHAHTPPC